MAALVVSSVILALANFVFQAGLGEAFGEFVETYSIWSIALGSLCYGVVPLLRASWQRTVFGAGVCVAACLVGLGCLFGRSESYIVAAIIGSLVIDFCAHAEQRVGYVVTSRLGMASTAVLSWSLSDVLALAGRAVVSVVLAIAVLKRMLRRQEGRSDHFRGRGVLLVIATVLSHGLAYFPNLFLSEVDANVQRALYFAYAFIAFAYLRVFDSGFKMAMYGWGAPQLVYARVSLALALTFLVGLGVAYAWRTVPDSILKFLSVGSFFLVAHAALWNMLVCSSKAARAGVIGRE